MKQTFLSYLVIASIFASASQAEFQVNTYTTSNQANAAIAMDGNGHFVVVWSSYLQDGSSNGIFGQRFDSGCNPLGGEFQINTTTSGNQKEPSVAMDAAGNFVVTWHGPGDNQEDIFARRFDPNGQPLGDQFPVNSDPNGQQLCPRVAMSDTGAFVIVWENDEFWPQFHYWEVFYQLYSFNGTPIRTDKVNLLSQSRCPDVAMDGNGNFTIIWMQDDTYYPSNLVMARQYYADGSDRTQQFEVSTTGFTTIPYPAIGMDGSGHFVVAWDGHPSGGSLDDIYARRYKFDGTAMSEEFQVNTTQAGAQQNPRVAMNNQRQFVIVWNSETEPGTNERNIFGQRYDSLYNPLGDEFQINTYMVDDQKYPAVAIKENAEFVTLWQSDNQDGSDYGIFGETGPKIRCADFSGDGFVSFRDFYVLADEWLREDNPLEADLIDDNTIDRQDLGAFCEQWLTPCYQCNEVDINGDGKIDFKDYALWTGNWLEQGPNLDGDITGEGVVDMADLKALVLHWAKNCERHYQCSEVDIYSDGRIDFKDYCFLAGNWLKQGPDLDGDITGDGIVDMADLKPLVLHWATNCQ